MDAVKSIDSNNNDLKDNNINNEYERKRNHEEKEESALSESNLDSSIRRDTTSSLSESLSSTSSHTKRQDFEQQNDQFTEQITRMHERDGFTLSQDMTFGYRCGICSREMMKFECPCDNCPLKIHMKSSKNLKQNQYSSSSTAQDLFECSGGFCECRSLREEFDDKGHHVFKLEKKNYYQDVIIHCSKCTTYYHLCPFKSCGVAIKVERHHIPSKNSPRSYFNNFNVHINDAHFYPVLQKTLAESPPKKQKSEEPSRTRKEPIIFAINSIIDPIPINRNDLLFVNAAAQVGNNNPELFATQFPDIEEPFSQVAMALELDNNDIPNTLSANQDQLIDLSFASSIGHKVGKGCIIFYFFYDSDGIKKLKEHHMNKETGALFENGIPIRYVGDTGDIIEKVLPVEHISIFALFTEKEKDELIKEDIIDPTPIRIHENTNIKLMRYKGISKMIQLPLDNEATITTTKVIPKVSEARSSLGRRGSAVLNCFRRTSSTSACTSGVKIAEDKVRISGETEVLSCSQENPRIGNQKNTTSNALEEAKNLPTISTKEVHKTSEKKDIGTKAVRNLLQVISDFPYEIDFLRPSIKKIRELYQNNKELSNDVKLIEDVNKIIQNTMDVTDDKGIQSNCKVILEIFTKESPSKPASKEATAEVRLKIPGTKGAKDSYCGFTRII